MDGLVQWIGENKTALQIVIGAVIGLVAVGVIGLLILKAITASRKSKMNEVGKHAGMAVVVALLAMLGIGGILMLVEKIAPNESILPRDANSTLTSMPANPMNLQPLELTS